jgi:hypothetical protein
MERVIQGGPLQGKRCVVLSVVGDKVEAEVEGRVVRLPAAEVFGNGGDGNGGEAPETRPQPQSSTSPIKSFGGEDGDGDGWGLEHLPPELRALFEKREVLWRMVLEATRKELGPECRPHMVPRKRLGRFGWEVGVNGKSFWFPAKGDLKDFRKRLAEFLLRHTRLASRA